MEEILVNKIACSKKPKEGVPKVNQHLYFRSEESEFSEFSDLVANQEDEAERMLKKRHKRLKRKKTKEWEVKKGGL